MIPRRRTAIDAWSFLQSAWRQSVDDIGVFEAAFAAQTGCAHAVAGCSGRTTLVATLQACGLQPGDEVIVPALTLLDLPELLQRHSWVPVFVDVDRDTYLMDPVAVRQAVTSRTRAILPTDLFGNTVNWIALLGRDARAAGATIIEDAAHAAGTKLNGEQAGCHCDVAFFSLETIKTLHAFGGGVVVTNDAPLARRIRAALPNDAPSPSRLPAKFLRNVVENVGFRTPAYAVALAALDTPALKSVILGAYEHVRQGSVATATAWTPWQARFARGQMAVLDERIAKQRRVAQRIMDGLAGVVTFQREPPGVVSNRYFLVGTIAGSPVELRRNLLRSGIDVGVGAEIVDFCPPATTAAKFPNAQHIYDHMIQLPLFASLTDDAADRIVAAIRRRLVT